jgi:selenocysteine lyase/cysteine desulfurase
VGDQAEAEVDTAFQALMDLINASPDYVVFGAKKTYGASVSITVTS